LLLVVGYCLFFSACHCIVVLHDSERVPGELEDVCEVWLGLSSGLDQFLELAGAQRLEPDELLQLGPAGELASPKCVRAVSLREEVVLLCLLDSVVLFVPG